MLVRVLLSMFLMLLICKVSRSGELILWEIGKADNDYRDLALPALNAYRESFPNGAAYRAGKDDPAKSWPYLQPGPADAWAGSRIYPFTIEFDLSEKPRGMLKLSINLLGIHSGMPPVYEIDINGRKGEIPLPAGKVGIDAVLSDPAMGVPYTINLSLPADYFRKGENRIILQSKFGSWLVYDAVRLASVSAGEATEPAIRSIELTPTVCIVRRSGHLKQVVHINASFAFARSGATITVKLNGETRTQSIDTDILGNASVEFEINEVIEPVSMTAEITSGGQTKSAAVEVRPQRHWILYLQPTAHVDIGYSDVQEKVADVHNRNMDIALDLCDKHPDFIWNTEVAWVQSNYLKMMPEDKKEQFIRYAREGRIGCQALFGNMLTGICSHEGLIRTLYYAKKISLEHGIPFDIASTADVASQVSTLPTVLAGAGIKYYSTGLNFVRGESLCRTIGKAPFYWQGPDGSKVLTWLAPGYGTAATVLGLDTSVPNARKKIEDFLRAFNRDDYPYDAVFGFGAYPDNTPLDPNFGQVVRDWNKTYAYPKVILCRGPEFFKYLESKYKEQIPIVSTDPGVYWEDGAGSSANETGMVRRAKEQLVSAEKLFSLCGSIAGTPYPEFQLDAAWTNALTFDEHTWGSGDSVLKPESTPTVEQWKRKAAFAHKSADQACSVLQSGLDLLPSITAAGEPSVLVFNPLSWTVSGLVNVKDAKGRMIEFWAEDVPSMGLKAFPLNSITLDAACGSDETTLENRFYRVEFDAATGAVKSLFDKELGLELVDKSSRYGINQYAYYADQGDKFRDATREGATSKVSLLKEIRSYGSAMAVKGSAYMTPEYSTEIVLYDNVKRIDFLNTINKTPTYDKEAGYFAFPFNLENPEFRIELPNGVLDPAKNMMDGACMAWYTTQDFVAAFDKKAAVVWTSVDSPLITLCDVNREKHLGPLGPFDVYSGGLVSPLPINNGSLYAYAFNNYWFTNYKASQGGTMQFRYALTSMKSYDSTAASKFGQSVRNPLSARVSEASGGQGAAKLPYSFCTLSTANVYVQAIKRGASGDGTIIRLREVGGRSTVTTVSLPAGMFNEAWICNLMEDSKREAKISGGKVKVTVPANGLVTLRVR